MSRKEKLINRFLECPSDFTFNELTVMLDYLGFECYRQDVRFTCEIPKQGYRDSVDTAQTTSSGICEGDISEEDQRHIGKRGTDMKRGYLEYNGYTGSVEYSAEDDCLFGEVIGMKSLMIYQGESLEELRDGFRQVVDEYIASCEETGQEPQRPYKGSFNIRVGRERHMKLGAEAFSMNMSINSLLNRIIDEHFESA